MSRKEAVSNVDNATLGPLERGILLTVHYSDLFDYPLTVEELGRYLVVECPSAEDLRSALGSLIQDDLVMTEGYVGFKGRHGLVALRQERHRRSQKRWPQARRYARWLARVPFLRMVGVCGSQAVENPGSDSDIDFFCITEPGRLWTVQVCAMLLRRVARLYAMDVCPNYFMTLAALEVEEKNLYTAHEVAQVVPLWGGEFYQRWLEANPWVVHYLPNLSLEDRRRFLSEVKRPWLTRFLEKVLAGKLGDGIDRLIHRLLLLYYPLRLAGRSRAEVARAYRRDRQTVITGGYAGAVQERFLAEARRRLDGTWVNGELERLFPHRESDSKPSPPDPVYSRLMADRYGAGNG